MKYSTETTLTDNTTITRTGYTFTGWNTQANGKGTAYANNAKVSKLTAEQGATVTLYAQWKATPYTITYDLDGGTNNSANPTEYTIESDEITLKPATKTGFAFLGWYNEKDEKVETIAKGSTGAITLKAKWKANSDVTIEVRPAGDPDNFDYAAAYAAAGVTVMNGTAGNKNTATITVDYAKATGKNVIDEKLLHGNSAYVGLQFTTPENAKKATLTVKVGDNNNNQDIDLTKDGDYAYKGSLIEYLGFASKNDDGSYTVLPNTTYDITVVWKDADSKALSTDTYTVNRVVTNVNVTVTSVDELKAAVKFADANITVSGTIGATDNACSITIENPVTITGKTGSSVIGTFIVKDVTGPVVFDSLTIQNVGDTNTEHRNAINFYGDDVTIKDCYFKMGLQDADTIHNGVSIFVNTNSPKISITGNTFEGYEATQAGYASAGLLISGGYRLSAKPFFGEDDTNVYTKSVKDINVDDVAIITGNTFTGCKNDYTRNDWSDWDTGAKSTIYATSNSHIANFRLSSAAEGANYYVTGTVERTTDENQGSTEIKAKSTMTITADNTLTLADTVELTVNGKLVVANGASIIGKGGGSKIIIGETGVVEGVTFYSADGETEVNKIEGKSFKWSTDKWVEVATETPAPTPTPVA